MQRCKYFDSCSAVKCPLDELMGRRIKLSFETSECRLNRDSRLVIGGDMETKGLFPREVAGIVQEYSSLEAGIQTILNRIKPAKTAVENNGHQNTLKQNKRKIEGVIKKGFG